MQVIADLPEPTAMLVDPSPPATLRARVAAHPALRHRVFRHHLTIRATKSLIGSIVASIVSEIAFASVYGLGLLGTTASSGVAFVAGAIPNYVLNRRWAWQRRGRVRFGREVVLYVIVSLLSFGAAAVVTGWTSHFVISDHLLKVALVSGAYLATYAVLFGAKFAVYELVVFVDPDRRRSRHQVPTTTLENLHP